MKWFALILVLLISACASTPTHLDLQKKYANLEKPYKSDLFKDEFVEIEELNEVFYLTEEQKEDFLAFFNDHKNRKLYPNKRISKYLNRKMQSFNFYSDTLTASQALGNQLGNCLSLAIVTHALADLVGVKVKYELVNTPPIFQREGDIVLASQHVQSLLLDPTRVEFGGRGPMFPGSIRVDYYPVGESKRLRRVEHEEFFTMFYRNKAAESMAANRLNLTYAYLLRVFKANPVDGQALNIMAVLHERIGEEEAAEDIYKFALEYSEKSSRYDLLYNYHLMLLKQGRTEEANSISNILYRQKDINPFRWVSRGDRALAKKEFSKAIKYYKKAIKLADYLHEPFAGMAKSYFALGKPHAAKRAMKSAIKNSRKQEDRNIYQLKYDTLVRLNR